MSSFIVARDSPVIGHRDPVRGSRIYSGEHLVLHFSTSCRPSIDFDTALITYRKCPIGKTFANLPYMNFI